MKSWLPLETTAKGALALRRLQVVRCKGGRGAGGPAGKFRLQLSFTFATGQTPVILGSRTRTQTSKGPVAKLIWLLSALLLKLRSQPVATASSSSELWALLPQPFCCQTGEVIRPCTSALVCCIV